jgi:hypothetical protein
VKWFLRELLSLNESEPIPILGSVSVLLVYALFAAWGLYPILNLLYLIGWRIVVTVLPAGAA